MFSTPLENIQCAIWPSGPRGRRRCPAGSFGAAASWCATRAAGACTRRGAATTPRPPGPRCPRRATRLAPPSRRACGARPAGGARACTSCPRRRSSSRTCAAGAGCATRTTRSPRPPTYLCSRPRRSALSRCRAASCCARTARGPRSRRTCVLQHVIAPVDTLILISHGGRGIQRVHWRRRARGVRAHARPARRRVRPDRARGGRHALRARHARPRARRLVLRAVCAPCHGRGAPRRRGPVSRSPLLLPPPTPPPAPPAARGAAPPAGAGVEVEAVLIDEVVVPEAVKTAMAGVVAAQRERDARNLRTDAGGYERVSLAKAKAAEDAIRARGVAEARAEVARGMHDAVRALEGTGVSAEFLMSWTLEQDRLSTQGQFARDGTTVFMGAGAFERSAATHAQLLAARAPE